MTEDFQIIQRDKETFQDEIMNFNDWQSFLPDFVLEGVDQQDQEAIVLDFKQANEVQSEQTDVATVSVEVKEEVSQETHQIDSKEDAKEEAKEDAKEEVSKEPTPGPIMSKLSALMAQDDNLPSAKGEAKSLFEIDAVNIDSLREKNSKYNDIIINELGEKFESQYSVDKKKIFFVVDVPVVEGEAKSLMKANSIELFAKIIKAMKIGSQDSYFTFIEDLDLLHQEIAYFKPEFVLTLGALPTKQALGKRLRLTQVHGKFYPYSYTAGDETNELKIVPIFHPDYLIINPKMKATTWNDLQEIMKEL